MRLQSLRGAPRPLIIEPQKRLKTEAESRFRANPDVHDNREVSARSHGTVAAAGMAECDLVETRLR